MACEFIAPPQTVALNAPIIFNDSIPCSQGRVYHDDGNGTFQLRGLNRMCPCGCRKLTEYQVTFNGNIAVPEDGTVAAIAVALAIDGEPLAYSRAIVTPAAVEQYFNVTSTAIITVPKGCCYTVAVENVNAGVGADIVDEQTISVADGNLTVARIA